MKRRFFSLAALIITSVFVFISCRQNKDIIPSGEYAPYISAYTGGIISSNTPVRIEFTEDIPVVELNTELKQNLFNFSPGVKGKAYWVNNRCIEFLPDSGEFKSGELYNVDFELGKVMEVDKKLEKFTFSFRVIQQSFVLKVSSFIASANKENGRVMGEIHLSDYAKPEDVKKMLEVDMDGDNSFTVDIASTEDSRVFKFNINDIKRGKEDRTLTVRINGKPVKVDNSTEEKVLIPAFEPFKVLSVTSVNDPENGVEIIFSDPVSTSLDLRGLISIPEVPNYVYQVDNNKVMLYFEPNDQTTITVNINQGVKSVTGHTLQSSLTYSLAIESLKPQIKFSNAGNILPDSKNLVLPFKSVNLWAVDLKIIRIYEKNVLMFMQTNTLASSSELRRSGRLIYKKTIQLNTDPGKKLSKWNDFSIDLTNLIKQESGAIYRVEMSFKKEYSLYPCGGEIIARGQAEGLSSLSSDELSEEDEAAWDKTSTYYYSGNENYDWDEYDWDDRDDPCKPTFYMVSENTYEACNVLASNLGIIVKGNASDKLWVTVNNILTTDPLSGVEVTAYNFQLQKIGSAKTDGDGFAVIDVKGKPFILVAESGKEKGYLRLVEGEDKSLSRFDTGGNEIEKGLKGYVFGERGVWRPGDTLFISFILEDRIKKVPENHPVSIELFNPKGQFYAKQTSTKGTNGFYTFKIPTNPDDITGIWNSYVKVGGASFHKSLRIETVKPNRLKINLKIPGERIEAYKGNIPASLSSNWLTGAVAHNLKASVEMTLSRVKNQFKGYEKYVFNTPGTSFSSESINLFEGSLNDEGQVNFNFKAPEAANAPGMLQANLVSRVFEPGGDVSTFIQSMPYSPFSSYVGLNVNQKEGEYYMETDKGYTFNIVTLNADGKPVNRDNLDYRVYKLNWNWWWENNQESFDSYINNSSATPVFAEYLKTLGGKAMVRFQINYPEYGRYLVYVKDIESGHATGQVIYVDWPAWRGRSEKADPSGISMLSFSTDKKSYEVGEEVTVIIPSAAPGRALVALENGSAVLQRSWVNVSDKGDTKYTFKVTEEMAPNFYIHISLLQPHAQTVNDLPIRMYGVVPVMVSNKNSVLHPEIVMPDVLQPEKEFTINVKERTGKPMTYTIAIVDDGLLDLTAFKTPDPWNYFYAREALGIRTWDMYDYVIGAYGGKFAPLFSVGGDETLKPSDAKANRFKPVVRFIGPFTLKKNSIGVHKVQLPPYVGSVRTMLVAAQGGAYGNAEKTTQVKSPLMILSTLPRVISTGEEIRLPVNVFAMENTVKDVSIKVETSGLSQLTDGSSKSLKFSRIGDQMAYFSLKTGAKTGVEKIKVTASGNGQTATETIEIQVRNPNPPVIINTSKMAKPSQEEDFTYHLIDNSNENWVKMEVSRIPSVDLNRRFDYLESYEHCCTEQLTSKAFPLLYADKFKQMSEKESGMIKANIKEAIRLLYARQLPNGGFVYWPGGTDVYGWINNYAGHFLCEARLRGYDVNPNVINKWKTYQRSLAQNWTAVADSKSRYDYYQSDLEQAYRLYTLAIAGDPELGAMNRMKEMKNLTPQAAWRLAATYAVSGKKQAAKELVFNVRSDIDPYSLNNSTYGSSYRDEAMILETMLLLDETQKAFEQAKKLSKSLNSEYYFSTQATAYSLLAMGKLAEKVSRDGVIQAEWSVNGKAQTAINSGMPVNQLDVPANVLSGTIKLKNTGKGDIFVSLTSKSKPVIDTLPAIANNLKLDVSYTDLNGHPVNINRIQQGTDFIAHIKVSNISGINDYTDLALTQIVPSGWEIFNERMISKEDEAPESPDSPNNSNVLYTYKDIRDDRVFTYFDLHRGQAKSFKVRLHAAYAGKFILPAIQCEAMYDTGAQARTTAGWTEVIK